MRRSSSMDLSTGSSPHRPLSIADPSEIRIVKLFPGNFGETVQCKLEHVSLNTPMEARIPYTALSYCWGDPHAVHTILLDGREYSITANLHNCLQHVQSILMAVTQRLSKLLHEQRSDAIAMVQAIMCSVLQDQDFPSDFPNTSDDVLHHLVKRHVIIVTEGLYQQHGLEPVQPVADAVMPLLAQTNALQHRNGCHLRLWIDALCINQRDLQERSVQVGRMRSIYASANALLIWPQDSSTLKEDLHVAAEFVRHLHQAMEPVRTHACSGDEMIAHITSDAFMQPRRKAILTLQKWMTQNWFSRIWIIQEVATSIGPKIVLLGFYPIIWLFLVRVVVLCCKSINAESPALRIKFRSNSKHLVTLAQLESEYQEYIKRTNGNPQLNTTPAAIAKRLESLLLETCNEFQTTQPHDQIYAILGLLGEYSIPHELQPNYKVDFAKVFHQYALWLVMNTNQVGFLSSSQRDITGVPSWAPDWRYVYLEENTSEHIYVPHQAPRISDNGMKLHMHGLKLGYVVTFVDAPRLAEEVERHNIFNAPTDDQDGSENELDGMTQSAHSLIDNLRQMKELCLERWTKALPGRPTLDLMRHWENFWDTTSEYEELWPLHTVLSGKASTEDWAWLATNEKALTTMSILSIALANVAAAGVAILDSGGLVARRELHQRIQPGDIVALLNGCSHPCILRPQGADFLFLSTSVSTSYDRDRETKNQKEYLDVFEKRLFTLI